MNDEDQSQRWTAHEQSHELEQKALTVALTANDALLRTIQDYIIKFVESELRKQLADHNNLVEQSRKDWAHHNEVHTSHGLAHEREHKQTQEAIDKAEKTALALSNTLSADVQRAVLTQAGLVTKPELSAELKAQDARITLLERGASTSGGREVGIGQFYATLMGVAGLALGIGFFIHSLIK